MPIKAIIFDIGGVLVRTEDRQPRQALAERFNLDAFELEEIFFGGESGHAAQRGEVTTTEHLLAVGRKLGIPPADIPEFRRSFFAGDRLDEGLLDFARGLRPTHITAIITNALDNVRTAMREDLGFDLAADFDHVVVSAEEGIMKPDPRIYRKALDLCGTAAEEAVFIDDFHHNVEGARNVGMQAIHFTDRDQTIRAIQSLL